MQRELVERQRQAEREVLAWDARIAGADRALAQLRGGLLDHSPVGPVLLDLAAVLLVVHVLLPVVALHRRPGEAGRVQHAAALRLYSPQQRRRLASSWVTCAGVSAPA